MALWGTKKKEDNDAVPSSPEPTSGMMPSRAPEAQAVSVTHSGRPSLAAPSPASARFGIDHTIHLMRSLPTDKNPDLVVTVMKTTLESVNVHIPDIIHDAEKRIADVQARVASLKSEIAAYEREVDMRLQEIVRLESAHAEVVKVKQCLEAGTSVIVDTDD
jgi:hypothetical protein